MKRPLSIRTRLIVGAAVVLSTFLAMAGYALERAFAASIMEARLQRLQSDVYLIMAAAELDSDGALDMPQALNEPRLSLPNSGLYAAVDNPNQKEKWQSASSLGVSLPFVRGLKAGQWVLKEIATPKHRYLSASFGVKWLSGPRARPMTFSVLEDETPFLSELARFRDTLWMWLGGAGFLLLLVQTALLSWGLNPLRRVAREIRRVEAGEQGLVEGVYPAEITPLTNNLNTLIEQERARQVRYKDALADLAHSLKTPLAVLRGSLSDPTALPEVVENQVQRMDLIVQHQLGRAAASGAARFAPPLAIASTLERIVHTLQKVYVERNLQFVIDCDAELSWRIDEGDAFETLGNLLDNAAKWAASRVRITVKNEQGDLHIVVEDDGPGFSDGEAALQRGVRLDERVPGHGIGLAVVADIVTAYAGTIAIDRGEWNGGRVSIMLRAT